MNATNDDKHYRRQHICKVANFKETKHWLKTHQYYSILQQPLKTTNIHRWKDPSILFDEGVGMDTAISID
jgi:hypothetical protein